MSAPVQVRAYQSAEEMRHLRPLWESLVGEGRHTIFQDFEWNLLAAEVFASREAPFVVCAQSSVGVAVVPAAVRRAEGPIGLLGEELFDYRSFLHAGDPDVLRAALHALSRLQRDLEVVAVRDKNSWLAGECRLVPFCGAPQVTLAKTTSEHFAREHPRLGRNLRRISRLGFEIKRYSGNCSDLLRLIYTNKAADHESSLFRDPLRTEFMIRIGQRRPEHLEVFTLERGASLGAALVTLRDGGTRRFYTGWFSRELEKHSPSLTLIHEVTRQSLADGLDCDYMTGEQPYKMRLATSSVPLYKVRATEAELAEMVEAPELSAA